MYLQFLSPNAIAKISPQVTALRWGVRFLYLKGSLVRAWLIGYVVETADWGYYSLHTTQA